ncbi:helix-turn-helix transcriptional regulator [Streptomyces sp. IB201691-2A2]|uniref:helix-turn-helix transcriptional regulator n=1 Tax=Streptomyces sp. IB201691-2A2 TaxID=2561920 RepID=UPI00117F6647|nr:helix-turn-helix transcriptional regulator [Streptomyces sp. IB201691-2A2]TRO58973.1 XRE family transcriptional regulator [Streptomyces sp. IB201691-2A2]
MTREQPAGGGTELGSFLRARRAAITPAEAGLTVGPGPRRTPGLRREELATLTGISIDYYVRLERGKETRPSPSVIDALAHALHLEEDEHEHLRSLVALATRAAPKPPAPPSRTIRPGVKLLLEILRPNPTHVVSRTNDLLAANPSGLRLLTGIEDWPARQRNLARYVFLHPASRTLFHDWATQVRGCVARLRALAGTDPDAPDLTRLAGELLLKSPEFARLWERYDIKGHSHGRKTFHHPDVGDLTLGYQSMELEGTPGHRLITYYAEPGTTDYDALSLLDLLGSQPTSHTPTPSHDEPTSPST